MTRYTKLARKTHEEAAGFQVTALRPSNADKTRSKAEVRGKKRCHEEATEQNSDDGQSSQVESNEGMQTKLSKRQRKIISAKKKRQSALAKVEQEGADADKANEITEKKFPKKASVKAEAVERHEKCTTGKKNKTICFSCRKQGHSVNECPEAKEKGIGICFNCGSTEHTLKECKKSSGSGNQYKFAKCFICNVQGHLSAACPQNDKGLYPNGGSCRFCGKVDHLFKDCKITKEEVGTTAVGKIDLAQGADDDDFHIFVSEKMKAGEEKKVERLVEKAVESRIGKAVTQRKKVVSF